MSKQDTSNVITNTNNMISIHDPVVKNYGKEKEALGYENGYFDAIADRRMRLAKRKKLTDNKFKKVLSLIETYKD